MPTIHISEHLCTKCNMCSTICVMGIIQKATESTYPSVFQEHEPYCIQCGHCESYCNQQALTLDHNSEKVPPLNPINAQIEPERLSLYIQNRRSVRNFTPKVVDKETITSIMKSVRYSPTGGNSQTVQWIVVYDKEKVKRISELTIDWMRSIEGTTHPLSGYIPGILAMWDKGEDVICRNAPHLIIAHIPCHEAYNDPTDGVIAMTHFDILAPAYGLGACWAGFVKMALEFYPALAEFIGIPEGRKAVCPIFFGYPRFKTHSIPNRKQLELVWK